MIISENSGCLGYSVSQKHLRLVKLLEVVYEIEKVFARRFGRDHPESVALRGEFDDLKEKLAACRLRAQLASTQQCDDRSLS